MHRTVSENLCQVSGRVCLDRAIIGCRRIDRTVSRRFKSADVCGFAEAPCGGGTTMTPEERTRELDLLSARANDGHRNCQGLQRQGLSYAVTAGTALLDAKKLVGH